MSACYICVDGGTTNTRLYYVKDNKVLETVRLKYGSNPKDKGLLAHACKDAIRELLQKYETPECVIGCGMLTSEYGLYEVRHLPTPCGIAELHNGIKKVCLPEITSLPIYLIPGLKCSDGTYLDTDMMRGEETELLGLVDRLSGGFSYILPGSHSKIICADSGNRIYSIRTFLTGEMVAALSANTILSGLIDIKESIDAKYLFEGFRFASSFSLNEALLKVRIMSTQFRLSASACYSFFLGACLEGEVSEIIKIKEETVVIGGQAKLKEATALLLNRFSNKKVIECSDEASQYASVKGMIKIFTYNKEKEISSDECV